MGIEFIIVAVLCLVFFGLYVLTNINFRQHIKNQNSQDIELQTQNAILKQSEESLKLQLSEIKSEISNTLVNLDEEKIKRVELETQLKAAEKIIESEKSLLDKAQDSFKTLATEALAGTNKSFLELAKTSFDKHSQSSQSELDKRKESIEELLKPLNENLRAYQTNLSDIEKQRIKTYAQLESEITKIATSHDDLSKTTIALKDALKKPHVRGRWGEVQLKNCIEIAGMSEHSDVSFQDNTTLTSGEMLRPDMVVRMPGDRKVIVDCKTPIDAFLSSLEATTEEARHTEMVRHGKHVKKHIQDLSAKDYAKSIKGSADFTVMFLPNESFLYAALETETDLVEYALEKKILIATPPTLIGLLKVIRYGWSEQKLTDNALKISEAGKELHKRICDFVDAFTGIGRHLDKAKEEYDKGLSRLERRVLVQTKRLETLGAKSKKSLPVELDIESENPQLTEAAPKQSAESL